MRLIFIYGLPATGKLTVAQELAKRTGYKLFHNHLKRRIDSPSRLQYQKLSSLTLFAKLQAAGEFDTSHMPAPGLTIDTSLAAPMDAAKLIKETFKL